MTQTHASTVPANEPTATSQAFVARQPIFDAKQNVVAYELLFRDGLDNKFRGGDGAQATRMTIDTTVHLLGIDELVGSRLAFFNITRDLLIEGFYDVLPPGQAVVELLENIAPDAEVLHACRRLKGRGYKLALDDFVFDARYAPLIPLADIIKVEFPALQPGQRMQCVREHARPGLNFLAEKVETHEEYQQARKSGYTMFQGYFFCKPQIVPGAKLPGSKQRHLMLLKALTEPNLDRDQVEQALKLDPALSVKLLRYINSAAFGVRHEVRTIRQAMGLLGDLPLRKWGSLVAMTGLGDGKPSELTRSCLFRGRFCELVGPRLANPSAQMDLFLLGLLSRIDAMTDKPTEQAIIDLPLPKQMKQVLIGDDSPHSRLLLLTTAAEQGDWPNVELLARPINLDMPHLAAAHRQALQWADEML